jgi:hypothetical protein
MRMNRQTGLDRKTLTTFGAADRNVSGDDQTVAMSEMMKRSLRTIAHMDNAGDHTREGFIVVSSVLL